MIKNTRNKPLNKPLQEFRVNEAVGLLDFLLAKNVRKSRNAIKSLLAHKQINVNGRYTSQFDYQLQRGDLVEVMKNDQSKKDKKLKGIKVVYEDEFILIVDKDHGILSVSTEREKERTAFYIMNEYIRKKKKDARLFVVHKLDREMSGLLIFAKDMRVQSAFQKSWEVLVKDQIFTAVIQGQLEPNAGIIDSWLTENKNFKVFSANFDNGGEKATTRYSTSETSEHFSIVDFRMLTRKKNQIRAQMEMLKHFVVGDKKYGSDINPIKRIAMHARLLQIKHPITNQLMLFESPLPKVMRQLLDDKQN